MRINIQYKYLLPLLYLLISCAEKAPCESLPLFKESATFWLGLWHGFILFFSLLGKVLTLNIGIHEVHSVGFQYWLGYFVGFVLFVKIVAFMASIRGKTL